MKMGRLKKFLAFAGAGVVASALFLPMASYAASGGNAMVAVGLTIDPVFSVKVVGDSAINLGVLTPAANPIEDGEGTGKTSVAVHGNGGTTYTLLVGTLCQSGSEDYTALANTNPEDPMSITRDEKIQTITSDGLTNWGGVERGWGYKIAASGESENVDSLSEIIDEGWRKPTPLTCSGGAVTGGGRIITSGEVHAPNSGDGDVFSVTVGAKIDERLRGGNYSGTLVFYGYEEI
jgi:hypothetical protein